MGGNNRTNRRRITVGINRFKNFLMDIKPQNIYISLIDFFSVLLPGGLLTYFLSGIFYKYVFGDGNIFPEPTNYTVIWIVFVIVAYIVGNLVFTIASFLDASYDKILRPLFESKYDLTYKTARRIHSKYINTDNQLKELLAQNQISDADHREILKNKKCEIFNTFKWSQHFLLFEKPEALAEVQQVEANSKFFRSLVITFLIIVCLLFWQAKIIAGVVVIIFSVLCYYRFGELRFKTTEKAYEIIITAHHLEIYKQFEDIRQIESVARDEQFEETRSVKTQTEAEKLTVTTENQKAKLQLRPKLNDDFLNHHHKMISFLTYGFSQEFSQMSIAPGTIDNFVTDRNELWICLQGVGILHIGEENNAAKSCVMPNAIIPVTKDNNISFVNNNQETIELLVLEN